MAILKSEAIVLKSFDFRETSRIATFFTKNYGKIKGVLKGIRKDSKKFGSSADRFTVNDVVYYHYTHSEIHLISHCDLKQFFFPVRQDYKRSVAAHYALELIDSIMQIEQPNVKVYNLLLDYLTSLENIKDIDKLVHIFQIKILLHSGFRPHLDSCVRCRRKITKRARFSMKLGGLVCQDCPTQETIFTFISQGAVSSIIHIEQSEWSKALRLILTAPIKKELKFTLNNFLVYHLEKYIKSSKYL
jgi:DNA repair protein RecO (recombination protein O)